MNWLKFRATFPESGLFGYDLNDDEAVSYFWNGTDVGCWRVDRRTTIGRGDILSAENAEIARDYYKDKPLSRER